MNVAGINTDMTAALAGFVPSEIRPPDKLPAVTDEKAFPAGGRGRWCDQAGVLRTPVDRVAARVIAPQPWYSYAPSSEPVMSDRTKTVMILLNGKELKNDNNATKGNTAMRPEVRNTENPMLDGKLTAKSDEVMNMALSDRLASKTAKNVEESEELVRRAKDAAEAMEYLATHFKAHWEETENAIAEGLKTVRMTKFSVQTEMKQLLDAMKDVRQFFMAREHAEEIARLKEFVEVCERLKALKDCGFMDAVCDTMLNVSVASRKVA